MGGHPRLCLRWLWLGLGAGKLLAAAKKRSGSHVRRVSGVLFGVLFGVSVRPLNACPPVGPEALQAWSLFQGTKAWLEPRLELTGTCRKLIPALCSSRSAVLARTSILRSERFTVFKIDEKGVNKRPKLTLLGAEGGHAAQMGCRALPRRVIAPDRASRPAPTD